MDRNEVKTFPVLTTQELFQIYKLRVAVLWLNKNATTKKSMMTI